MIEIRVNTFVETIFVKQGIDITLFNQSVLEQ